MPNDKDTSRLELSEKVLRDALRAITGARTLISKTGEHNELATELSEMVITPLESLLYSIERGEFNEDGSKRLWWRNVKENRRTIGTIWVVMRFKVDDLGFKVNEKYVGGMDDESITSPFDKFEDAIKAISEWAGGQGWRLV